MTIRRATPADARAIAEVQTRAWWRAYQDIVDASLMADRAESREERWRAHLAAEDAPTLVAEVAGRIAGFVTVGPSRTPDAPPQEGELYALYVDPPAQGAGVGDMLLRAGEDELRRQGRTRAWLSVFDANGHARDFYAARGWVHDGARPVVDEWGPVVRYEREL